jgi:PKD repeat protein
MRWVTTGVLLLAALCCAGIATGCGARPAGTELAAVAKPSTFPELPPPSCMHPRAASLATHLLQGSEYRMDMIPPQRVALSGMDDGSYSPLWTNARVSTFDKLAFALYAFDFDDAGITGKLTFTWTTAPSRHACWIGLPNYSDDRWEWQELGTAPIIVPDLPLYIGTTPAPMYNMFPVVVLLTGSTPAVLDKLELTEYYPALFGLMSEPAAGTGEEGDPFQIDTKLTQFLSVFDMETLAEMAGDARVVFTVTPATAGEVQRLATSAAFHTKAGYTGGFNISASYDGNPTDPQRLYCTAIDNGAAPNQDPVPDLSAKPVYGKPPLRVDFDARDSYDPDGLVKIYRWDFDGDGTFDDSSNARTISHDYTADGVFDARLEIEDADGATASATARITVSSAAALWHTSIVQQAIPDGISQVGQFCSICEVDGAPAIAYSDVIDLENASRVNYVRAQDALGAAWAAPVELRRVNSATATTGIYVQLCQVAGQPAVAFAEQAGGYLPYYLRADDAQGAAWSGAANLVDSTAGVSCGQHVQLIDLSGVPALTYFEGTNGQLIWIKGASADGANFVGRTVLDTMQGHDGMSYVGEFNSLALVSGYPAVSYLARYIQAETGNQVRYLRAQDAAGDTWGAPSVIDQAPSIGHGTALLELASGMPGVFFQDYSLTQSMYSFVRGTDADGAGWSAKVSAVSSLDSNWFEAPSPVLWNDQPLLGCILQEGVMDPVCTAQCALALQDDGSAWQSPQAIAGCGDSYCLDMHVVAGAPAVCYYNSIQEALYFAIYY